MHAARKCSPRIAHTISILCSGKAAGDPVLVGTNLKYTKAHNYRIVLETIRLHGPLSRAEIARRTALTAQTITNITRKLFARDLIREAHRLQEGRGAPSTMLALNPDGAFSIGFDLENDQLTGVLVDLVGKVRRRIQIEIETPTPEQAVDLIVDAVEGFFRAQPSVRERTWGVGVGLPGPLDVSEENGAPGMVSPNAFPDWNSVPLARMLAQRVQLPVFIENNATAAAVGERWYGAGQHINTFFYVFLGNGLGGGVIINGQPYEGHTGNAGELGYFPIPVESRAAPSDDATHLGIYLDLPRLRRLLSQRGTSVRRVDELDGLFNDHNPGLLAWMDTAARQLAPLVLAIEYILDPEAIFFGGRLPESIIHGLMERIEGHLPSLRIEVKSTIPTLRYATAGADAAVLGVATLPFFSSFAPTPRLLMKGAAPDVELPFTVGANRVGVPSAS